MSGKRFLTVLASMLLALLGGAYAMHSWPPAPTLQDARPATSLAGLDARSTGTPSATDVTGLPPVLSFRSTAASAPAGAASAGAGATDPAAGARPSPATEASKPHEPVAPHSQVALSWPSEGPIASPIPDRSDVASHPAPEPEPEPTQAMSVAGRETIAASDAPQAAPSAVAEAGAESAATGIAQAETGAIGSAALGGTAITSPQVTPAAEADSGLPQPTERSFARAEEIAREANRRFTEILEQAGTGSTSASEAANGTTTVTESAPSQAATDTVGARIAEADGFVAGSGSRDGAIAPAPADGAAHQPKAIEFADGGETRVADAQDDATGILSRAADLASETSRRMVELWRRLDPEANAETITGRLPTAGSQGAEPGPNVATLPEATPGAAATPETGPATSNETNTGRLAARESDAGQTNAGQTGPGEASTGETSTEAGAARSGSATTGNTTTDAVREAAAAADAATRDTAEFANETLREIERQVERERLAAIEAARAPGTDGAQPGTSAAPAAARAAAAELSIAEARIEPGVDGRANVSASGRAAPGARLSVLVDGRQVATTTASDAGSWRLERALGRALELGGYAFEVRHADPALAIAERRSRTVALAPALPERLAAGHREALAKRRLAALPAKVGEAGTVSSDASSGSGAKPDAPRADTPSSATDVASATSAGSLEAPSASRERAARSSRAKRSAARATRRSPAAKRQVRHRVASHRVRRASSEHTAQARRKARAGHETRVVRLATRAARRHRIKVRCQRSSMLQGQHRRQRHVAKRFGECPAKAVHRFVRAEIRRLDRLQLTHIGWRRRYH